MRRALTLGVVLLSTLALAGKPERKPQPPGKQPIAELQKTLSDWVESTGEFAVRPGRLIHQGASEEVKAARAAYLFRESAPKETYDAFVTRLLARSASPDAWLRTRLFAVLGWLQAKQAVPLMARVAAAEEDLAADPAAKALGYFGAHPVLVGYFEVPSSVVFPPAPDERATAALLKLLPRRTVTNPDPRYQEFERERRRVVMEALVHHDGPEVDKAIVAALDDDPGLKLAALVAMSKESIDAPLEKIVACTHDKDDAVARMAVIVLGLSGKKEAIAPVIDALADPRPGPSLAAEGALHDLAGTESPEWLGRTRLSVAKHQAKWRRYFGKGFSKFDPKKARRPEDYRPGLSPSP